MQLSVVIPCYNGARFLPETLASIAAQTLAPAEVVVVDDGSTDDSVAVATRWGARVVRTGGQEGPSAARNAGGRAAARLWDGEKRRSGVGARQRASWSDPPRLFERSERQ